MNRGPTGTVIAGPSLGGETVRAFMPAALPPDPELTIDVELRSLTVRALDSQGRPIGGLGPGDFELRVGRETIPINSADWISSGGSRPEPLERSGAPGTLGALEASEPGPRRPLRPEPPAPTLR